MRHKAAAEPVHDLPTPNGDWDGRTDALLYRTASPAQTGSATRRGLLVRGGGTNAHVTPRNSAVRWPNPRETDGARTPAPPYCPMALCLLLSRWGCCCMLLVVRSFVSDVPGFRFGRCRLVAGFRSPVKPSHRRSRAMSLRELECLPAAAPRLARPASRSGVVVCPSQQGRSGWDALSFEHCRFAERCVNADVPGSVCRELFGCAG